MSTPSKHLESAICAFPRTRAIQSTKAAHALLPFIDTDYYQKPLSALNHDSTFRIPYRIRFTFESLQELSESINSRSLHIEDEFAAKLYCLLTRSTDGYIRQAALSHIIHLHTPWSIVYVMHLASEYVVEIIEDIVAASATMNRDLYKSYALLNRPTLRAMKQRAESYWDCYYRQAYPNKRNYPGIAFFLKIATWASEP